MTARKINYFFTLVFRKAAAALKEVGISWQYISLIIASSLLVLYLSASIYGAIRRGKENYQLISEEREKLYVLEKEGQVLSEEVQYTKSEEFKESFARDNLNYARKNQDLYVVKRDQTIEYEYLEKNLDPIVLDNFKEWWADLIFKI